MSIFIIWMSNLFLRLFIGVFIVFTAFFNYAIPYFFLELIITIYLYYSIKKIQEGRGNKITNFHMMLFLPIECCLLILQILLMEWSFYSIEQKLSGEIFATLFFIIKLYLLRYLNQTKTD